MTDKQKAYRAIGCLAIIVVTAFLHSILAGKYTLATVVSYLVTFFSGVLYAKIAPPDGW